MRWVVGRTDEGSIGSVTRCWAGQGSFGRVFLGKWRETTVAIKLLNEPGMLHPEPWDAPNAPASLASAHRCVLCPGYKIERLSSQEGRHHLTAYLNM